MMYKQGKHGFFIHMSMNHLNYPICLRAGSTSQYNSCLSAYFLFLSYCLFCSLDKAQHIMRIGFVSGLFCLCGTVWKANLSPNENWPCQGQKKKKSDFFTLRRTKLDIASNGKVQSIKHKKTEADMEEAILYLVTPKELHKIVTHLHKSCCLCHKEL